MYAYVEACRALDQAGVPYVIVGVFGINLYSERAGTVITTDDCDLLLPPDPEILAKALKALRHLGYTMEAGGEPLPGDDAPLPDIVRVRANIVAYRQDAQIDLALQIAGCDFPSLWEKQQRFKVEGGTVRVAPLEDLVRSKKLADRPKDRLFLEVYRHALDQLLRPPPKSP